MAKMKLSATLWKCMLFRVRVLWWRYILSNDIELLIFLLSEKGISMPSYDERLVPKVISSKDKLDVFIIRVLWTELRMSSHKDVFDFLWTFQIISQYFYLQANNTIFNYEDPKSNLNILCLASGKRLSIKCSSKSTDVLKLFIHARNGYSSADWYLQTR